MFVARSRTVPHGTRDACHTARRLQRCIFYTVLRQPNCLPRYRPGIHALPTTPSTRGFPHTTRIPRHHTFPFPHILPSAATTHTHTPTHTTPALPPSLPPPTFPALPFPSPHCLPPPCLTSSRHRPAMALLLLSPSYDAILSLVWFRGALLAVLPPPPRPLPGAQTFYTRTTCHTHRPTTTHYHGTPAYGLGAPAPCLPSPTTYPPLTLTQPRIYRCRRYPCLLPHACNALPYIPTRRCASRQPLGMDRRLPSHAVCHI